MSHAPVRAAGQHVQSAAAQPAGHRHGARILHELGRPALLQDPALIQHQPLVTQPHHIGLAPGADENAHAPAALHLPQATHHPAAPLGIQHLQRIIQQQKAQILADQGAADGHTLRRGRSQLAGAHMQHVQHPQQRSHLGHLATQLLGREPLAAQRPGQVLLDRQRRVDHRHGRHQRRASAPHRQAGHVHAIQHHLAATRPVQARQCLQQQRLAGPGRPEHRAQTAFLQHQVDVGQRRHRPSAQPGRPARCADIQRRNPQKSHLALCPPRLHRSAKIVGAASVTGMSGGTGTTWGLRCARSAARSTCCTRAPAPSNR